MFTEYIFENKKYEVAVRDLKATLFDIVAIEQAKLSNIEEKIVNEANPERREEIRELYFQQDECLRNVLTISNQLSDALITLDSYSKSLREWENANIAEIIASIGDKTIPSDHGYLEQEQDIVDTNDEVVKEENIQQEVTDAVQTSDEVVNKEVIANEEASAVAPENNVVPVEEDKTIKIEMPTNFINPVGEGVNEEVTDAVQTSDEVVNEEASVVAPENNVVPVEEDKNIKIEIPTNFVKPVGEGLNAEVPTDVAQSSDDLVNEEVIANEEASAVASENNVVPVEEEGTIQPDASTDTIQASDGVVDSEEAVIVPLVPDEVPITPEEELGVSTSISDPDEVANKGAVASDGISAAVSETDEATNDSVSNVVPEIDEAPVAPVQDEVSEVASTNDVASADVLLEPLNENVQTQEEVSSDDDLANSTVNENVSEVSTVGDGTNNLDGAVEQQVELDGENKEAPQMNNDVQKLKFNKSSNDAAKAILTSKNQITNLRKSRDTQSALLKGRGSLESNNATNNVGTVDSNLENGNIEQQLINNGLLEASSVDKQKQIEQMLEKANALYKEGKLNEAQAMYDQISALNKELQQENVVVK